MDWSEDFPQDHASVDWAFSGLPGELDIQQLLKDTEEKMNLNALSIEKSLKELQVKLGDSWPGDGASAPADCFQWFSPSNLTFLKGSCTGHRQLLDFLRALQHFLRTEEKGREEATLQLLLDISSQSGVAFPRPAPLAALHPVASSPVHVVREEAAVEVQEVWEDVRLLLRRHLLDKLKMAPDPKEGGSRLRDSRRTQHLQRLIFLYPEAEVLSRYQSVRVKAVQDVLQRARSSSPGETAFDRLSTCFRAASPTLLRLVEEDLHTLSSLVEPAMALAFVNHAHLATVTRELASLVEKLAENAAKDHRVSSGKGRKASAKSRVAVAPQEEAPRRGQSFCLTSHQLKQLTLLASVLLDLEEQVEELAAQLGFLCCPGETPWGMRGILKNTRDDLETTLREGSQSAAETSVPEATALEFDWRSALRPLAAPMARCVRATLEDVGAKGLQQEEADRTFSSALLALGNVPQARGTHPVSCTGSEPPKMIAKFAGDIMAELDALLPLALACRDDYLLDVRVKFVEVAGKVTSAVLGRLRERAREVPASAPLRNLPALLATAVYIQQRLGLYEDQAWLKDQARTSLALLPIQKSQELTEELREHLSNYCVQACATCILHDPQSHHWGDPKPFYEGERCSFSIQMWHYFLSGLRSDLWAFLPPGLAQELLGQVLSQTLEVLVQRYSRARPSYKRTQQVRADITAILLCVEQLMWSVCASSQCLVRPGPRDGPWVWSVHSLCNQLMNVLVVVTSPLPDLCKHLYRESSDESSSSSTEMPSCNLGAQWLRHINPSLFSEESLRRGVSAGDELGVVGRLRLVCSQPDCNDVLLLQALLQSDCVLLQVLLRHLSFCVLNGAEDPAEIRRGGEALLEAVFWVLSTLNCVPKALALGFESYFDEQHLWDRLCDLPDPTQADPAVLRYLRTLMAESVDGIAGNIIAAVTTWQASEDHATPLLLQVIPEAVLAKVPKEWNYMSQEPQEKETDNGCARLLLQAVSSVFANLPSAVASLPLPVRYLFLVGERRLSLSSRQPRPVGLLLWGLLGCLCRSLEDRGAVERLSGRPPSLRVAGTLALVAECLRAAAGHQGAASNPAVPEALRTLEEKRPKWRAAQLQKARELCAQGVFKAAESAAAPERGGVPELTEQKMGLMVLEIRHKAGGGENLRQIYHIIRLNEELLASLLAAPKGPAQATPKGPATILSLGPAGPRPPFNPIVQFNHIGPREFDQSVISDWSWDWIQLLPSYQRMSQVTLKTLLANRWDLQDSAPLEDEERALAELLRRAFLSAGPGS